MKTRLRLRLWFLLSLACLPAAGRAAAPAEAVPDAAAADRLVEDLAAQLEELKGETAALQEKILFGPAAASRARVLLKDSASRHFELKEWSFTLDGRPLPGPVTIPGAALGESERIFFDGELRPGTHALKARLVYAARKSALSKVFRYLRDYRFVVETNHPFQVVAGQTTEIVCAVGERPEAGSNWGQRLIADCSSASDLEREFAP